MDKNAIKKYAIWARNELIARIAQKALRYGISKDSIVDAYADSIDGVLLSAVEKRQRQALIAQIETKGFEQVVEEVAYTWFNRFCALRFMEVNGYLPSNIRVLSDEGNNFKPEILTKAIELNFESLDMETVYSLKEANKDEELYRYLLIVQCNELNKILPHMFQQLEDYTELLLPDNLLREGSVVEQLVSTIPQEDFDINQGGQVEIIGWLYQYYNTEPKAETFALLKKNVKITKERIPSATQLFTPDWIVRYMVENSLGRIWVEGHPNDELKANWKYYLDEAKQEEAVEAELVKIRAEYANLNPKDIKVIDPCMGSGHILVYAFDVLMQIYTSVGYTEKEATISILENNLYGLDIDERAFQLAYFAVMMKARQYHKFVLKKQVQCNIHPIVDSNGINVEQLRYFGVQLDDFSKNAAITQMQGLIAQMYDAKEYGSIITVDDYDWELLHQFVEEFDACSGFDLFNANGIVETQQRFKEIVGVGEVLAKKYEVVVTNPPYMGAGGMSGKLTEFVKRNFPNSKSDLFAVFMEVCNNLTIENGKSSLVTMNAWMFLSSYEQLRKDLINNCTIQSINHLGMEAFDGIIGKIVQTVAYSLHKGFLKNYCGRAVKLTAYYDAKRWLKESEFFNPKNNYIYKQENFSKIPGSPIAYWVSDNVLKLFSDCLKMSDIGFSFQGIITGDNTYYLRNWFEPSITKLKIGLSNEDKHLINNVWVPYNKGGGYRKWYGNNDFVLRWIYEGKKLTRARTENKDWYFKEGVTWSFLTSSKFSCRFFGEGYLWDVAGSSIFSVTYESNEFIAALMNSKVAELIFKIINPTLNFQVMNIISLPYMCDERNVIIKKLSKKCILLAKNDWDSFETSWDFGKHPLV